MIRRVIANVLAFILAAWRKPRASDLSDACLNEKNCCWYWGVREFVHSRLQDDLALVCGAASHEGNMANISLFLCLSPLLLTHFSKSGHTLAAESFNLRSCYAAYRRSVRIWNTELMQRESVSIHVLMAKLMLPLVLISFVLRDISGVALMNWLP